MVASANTVELDKRVRLPEVIRPPAVFVPVSLAKVDSAEAELLVVERTDKEPMVAPPAAANDIVPPAALANPPAKRFVACAAPIARRLMLPALLLLPVA